MAKCMVTGGAGFIGSHIARRLLTEGHEVVVVDNLLTGRSANLEDVLDDLHFVEADVRDFERMKTLLRGTEIVYHEAALGSVSRSVANPLLSHDHNVNGTISVFLAARDTGVRRVVYAGSSSAYGNTEILPKTETMPAHPLSPYAVTKHIGELYGSVFSRLFGLEVVTLRYFNVFGPRQDPNSEYSAVIPRFITALLRGERPIVQGDGTQTRDFTYIDNVVNANLLAARAPSEWVAGETFNIGCGDETSLNELLAELQKITETDLEPIRVEARPGDVQASRADIDRASKAFGYQPTVSIREGLSRTVAWFRHPSTIVFFVTPTRSAADRPLAFGSTRLNTIGFAGLDSDRV